MNLYESICLYKTFNNNHLDFKQGPSGNVFKTRIYFVSHRSAFTAASARLEFFSSLFDHSIVYTQKESFEPCDLSNCMYFSMGYL